MAAAKVEYVFLYGALFLEKATCARKRFFFLFFFWKLDVILTFLLHWQDDFCSFEFTPILIKIDLRANGERQTSNPKPQFDVWGKRGSSGL